MSLWKGAHQPSPWEDGSKMQYTEEEQRRLYEETVDVPRSAVEDIRRGVIEHMMRRTWPTAQRFSIPASRGSTRGGEKSRHPAIVPHPQRKDREGYEEGMKEVWATLCLGPLKDHTGGAWIQAAVSGLAQADAYVRQLEKRLALLEGNGHVEDDTPRKRVLRRH